MLGTGPEGLRRKRSQRSRLLFHTEQRTEEADEDGPEIAGPLQQRQRALGDEAQDLI